MEHLSVKVYPLYLDSLLKQKEGRRITKEQGIENPNIHAMVRAVKTLGFEVTLEERVRHPRDFWRFGRLNVVFFKQEGKDAVPINPEINTRKKLFIAIAKDLKEHGNTTQSSHNVGKKMDSAEKSRMKRELRKSQKKNI